MLEKWMKPFHRTVTNVSEHDSNHEEYIQYAQDLEQTLSALEAYLHESDSPDDIITHTLETACNFYGGDWAGFLEVDLDLGLWTPYVWYNKNPEDQTELLVNEFESSEFLYRWVAAMKENLAVIVPDREKIKDTYPDEYDLYRRLRIHSVLSVPVKPRPTGFLAVRNPKRYINRSSMLQMLAFVVLATVNEKKLLDSVKMVSAPESIKNETDILIHLFGELEIYTSQGVLRETDLKSPKISRLLTYLLLNNRSVVPPREIAEAIWPEEAYDQENPGKNMKALIYRLRQTFGLISNQQLIESTAYGYRLNPKLNIMTDIQQFEQYAAASQNTASVTKKVELLKKAMDVYKGNILTSAAGEHWLIHTASHYNLKYLGVANELLKTLAELNDFTDIHHYATQALKIEPGNLRAYYWLISAMHRQGATEMVKVELNSAEQNLTKEEYDELVQSLKSSKAYPLA